MAETCVHIGLYGRLSCGVGAKSVCTIRAVPHAGATDADAICCVRNTDSKDEWTIKAMVPNRVGAGSAYMSGMELV